jgi:Tfp pilus assembly major pilin PilA
MKTNRNIKGFTLLETLLVLVIIISIILIAGRYYNQATEASKISTAISKIKRITEASYEWVKVAKTFDGKDPNKKTLSIQTLKDQNLLSASDDTNPWGGSALQVASVSANKIRITISNVPAKVCTVLIDHLKPQNMDVGGCSTASKTGTTVATIDYPADAT